MKLAFVIDFLMQRGGAEWLLETMHSFYPNADIFTLLYEPGQTRDYFRDKNIIVPTVLKRIPFMKRHWRKYLPLFPFFMERFDFSGYDLVVSISFLFAKGIRVPPQTRHICYCLTPMRQAWDEKQMEYRFISRFIWGMLRRWDIETANRPHKYIAISETVAARVKQRYKRDSTILYPPVDTAFFTAPDSEPLALHGKEYFLVVSRLVPYKKVDLVVETFRNLPFNLKIVGSGRQENKLKKIAQDSGNMEFLGEVSPEKLRSLYYNCQAVICAQEEDFGIVAAEAQVCGKPVIAFARGGITEIITDKETGVLFREQSTASLSEAVHKTLATSFNPDIIREKSTARFSRNQFKEKLSVLLKQLIIP